MSIFKLDDGSTNYNLISGLSTRILGAITTGVTTAIATNQKVKAYQDAANKLANAASEYSGYKLNDKMTQAGLKNADEWNKYNLEVELQNGKNPSGFGLGNYRDMKNTIDNTSDYMNLYSQGANREKAIADAEYSKTANDVNRQLSQADTDFNVATQTAQTAANGIAGLSDFANTSGLFTARRNPLSQGGKTAMNKANMVVNGSKPLGQAVSDEREKDKLPHADIQDSLRQIESITYKYKDPTVDGADEGVNVGTTAQSLEKTPLFESTVVDSEDGLKRVDQKKLLEAVTAGIAELQREIDDVE